MPYSGNEGVCMAPLFLSWIYDMLTLGAYMTLGPSLLFSRSLVIAQDIVLVDPTSCTLNGTSHSIILFYSTTLYDQS